VAGFDPYCRRCSRLAAFLDEIGSAHPDYHARPVPSFGDPRARLLVVGLAPGLHGANATGRPFTGDDAGELLYRTLYAFGLSSAPRSQSADDGLVLRDCRITNAVRCVPPANRPRGDEVRRCRPYLIDELTRLPQGGVALALGRVAHEAVLRAFGLSPAHAAFGHGACYPLPGPRWLLDSYHCSRYNTRTRRLTEGMFAAVFEQAVTLLGSRP